MTEKAININVNELKKVKFRRFDYGKKLKNISKEVKRPLKVAAAMDNKQADKVGLIFRTKRHGRLQVKSPVLMLGTNFVVLKGGNILPVGSIEKVIV